MYLGGSTHACLNFNDKCEEGLGGDDDDCLTCKKHLNGVSIRMAGEVCMFNYYCGDGYKESYEECDINDPDLSNSKTVGCEYCHISEGFSCTGNICTPECEDGILIDKLSVEEGTPYEDCDSINGVEGC